MEWRSQFKFYSIYSSETLPQKTLKILYHIGAPWGSYPITHIVALMTCISSFILIDEVYKKMSAHYALFLFYFGDIKIKCVRLYNNGP